MACSVPAGAQTNPARSSSSGENDPIVIEAERLSGRPDVDAQAEGKVELRRGSLVLRADRVDYRQADGIAKALGNVQVESEGARFTGPELQLQLERFEGYFLEPTYFFSRLQAGGQAERFDFIDRDHGVATDASYTSCTPEDPAWVLSARRVSLDMAKEEGRAEGGVLRFYGVPILAAPSFTFPLSDARKSGWLPPSFNLDNKSGLDLSVPYYWNIAPNMDATIVPTVMSRRGVGAGAEFRYLQPRYEGEWRTHVLPDDREANRSRWSLDLHHESRLTTPYVGGDADVGFALQRASDDEYWKDFSRTLPSDTQRLLPGEAHALRRFDNGWGDTWTYANVQTWQVLQDEESPILTPYRRLPQVGVRQRGALAGFEWDWQTEANRFSRVPTRFVENDDRIDDGTRVHALGRLARPFYPLGTPSWAITPRLALNAASYDLDEPLEDGRRSASRVIPTVSLDSAWVLERQTEAFGRALTQTLEPRLLYVNTPYKRQDILPNFDSAAKDLNFTSIFADNDFSGVDRVSDANQFTGGVTTRFLDRQTGAELLRLGIVQRLLLRDQRITEDDGAPITQRWSDMLLLGSTNLVPRWWLDASVQYSPEIGRAVRSIVNARYSPGPFRTVNMTYRYSRDNNEQIEFGWQWPLNEPARLHAAAAQAREAQALDGMGVLGGGASSGSACGGAWYGVGRVSYNRRDSRLTDSILGVEYDSGCWIGRIVAERLSTGRSEATTRLLLQLELVGLSRLGSNPLGVLRDNIPGYRLLRDDPNAPPSGAYATPMSSSR